MSNIQIWDVRWDGLFQYMNNLLSHYKPIAEKNPRINTIMVTIECLKQFGHTQYGFFRKSFLNDIETDNFPAENAIAATLDQISYDIAVLEKAATQRMGATDVLKKADYLAYEAIRPLLPQAIENEEDRNLVLREDTTVLTYFQKSASVRIIPYAPIVLVGIPFTCLSTSIDFLAIPHEVGHYIYRHSLLKVNAFNEFLEGSDFDELTKSWFEEIFSDIYGALIAGPVIGLSFQDLQMNKTIKDFYTDDGEHPLSILRPYIYINLFKISQNQEISGWISLLAENWKKYLLKRSNRLPEELKVVEGVLAEGELPKFKLIASSDVSTIDEYISMSEERITQSERRLDKIIIDIREILFRRIPDSSWPFDLSAPKEGQSVTELYTKFVEFIEGVSSRTESIPELRLGENGIILVNGISVNRKIGDTGLPIEGYKNEFIYEPDTKFVAEEWLRVLDAGGWTVKGPDCEGTGLC